MNRFSNIFRQFNNDNRGQSVLIGVIFLIGILVIALAIYQSQVVPQENSQVETNSYLETIDDMRALKIDIDRASRTGNVRSSFVTTGTAYKSGILRVNPLPARGSLTTETVDDGEIRINNAVSVEGQGTETYWDGTEKTFTTNEIRFTHGYNEITANDVVYSSGSVFIDSPQQSISSNSNLIEQRQINLFTINGDLQTQSIESEVPLRTTSRSSESVVITGDTDPVEISIPTTQSVERWDESVPSNVVVESDGENRILLTLPEGTRYELQMAEVVVDDSDTTGSDEPAYLYRVTGDGVTVQDGSQFRLQTQLRDNFNNPISGEDIEIQSDNNINIDDTSLVTNSDGTVTAIGTANAGGQGEDIEADVTFTHPDTGIETTYTVTISRQQGDGSGGGGGGDGGPVTGPAGLTAQINNVDIDGQGGNADFITDWEAESDVGIDTVQVALIRNNGNVEDSTTINGNGAMSLNQETTLSGNSIQVDSVRVVVTDVNGNTVTVTQDV